MFRRTACALLMIVMASAAYGAAEDVSSSGTTSAPGWFLAKSIRFFQKTISRVDSSRCNFIPTCSEYGRQCIHKYGAARGTVMTFDRIMRCHYCSGHGFYTVDEKRYGLVDDPEENNLWGIR